MPSIREILFDDLYNVSWKVALQCWTYLCRNAYSHPTAEDFKASNRRDLLFVRRTLWSAGCVSLLVGEI